MPKRTMQFLADHYIHLYNRGVNREPIFFSDDNYMYLLGLLKQKCKRYPCAIVAYCLMPNHYHFLLKPHRDNIVSDLVKSLFGAYTQAVNRQQGRQGPLFQGRFRAILVEEEVYFAHLARYIHANPVLVGLVDRCEMWRYSNYPDIIGLRGGTLRNDDIVPARFATGADYQAFVEDYIAHRRDIEGFERYLLE